MKLPKLIILIVSLLTSVVIGNGMSIQAATLIGMGSVLGSLSFFDTTSVSVLVLGFTLGLKHALDPDHLVAVSTIVSARKGIFSSSIVGGIWGLGHTLSLMLVGLGVIALHIRIPEKAALAMEFGVALMLIILGVNVLRVLLRGGTLHLHAHDHGGFTHIHPHLHVHSKGSEHHGNAMPHAISAVKDGLAGGKKSLFIGMVHGLAGSAALMLVVLATIPTPGLAMLYIGIFGIGSVGGMLIMSTLLGLPFVLTAGKFGSMNSVIRGLSGLVSLVFGLFLAWHIGVIEGLFL